LISPSSLILVRTSFSIASSLSFESFPLIFSFSFSFSSLILILTSSFNFDFDLFFYFDFDFFFDFGFEIIFDFEDDFYFYFGEGFLDVIFEDKADLLELRPVIHGVVFKGRHKGCRVIQREYRNC
jgi:hypothetical protein